MEAFLKVTELSRQGELRSAREALGWTQQDLAAASGLPRPVVSAVETGAAERLASEMRTALKARVADSLDADALDTEALNALRGLRRVQS